MRITLSPGVAVLAVTANLSTGGTAIDRTAEAHFDTLDIACKAAQTVGLDVAGIDIVASDITAPLSQVGGGIVEINASPGFRMHLQPSEGQSRNVAAPLVDVLFPPGVPSRISIIAITGTNGKTTTARRVAHILQIHGKCVGLATTEGIYNHGELYRREEMTGPWSAKMVLKDPTIEAAVLETARGGILREGLGFSRCDVGCVLNVQSDHLGSRGVETLEEMASVKSLVVEVVRPDGASVLNADDPLTVSMKSAAEGKVIFFSMHGNGDSPSHLREHIAGGGAAVVLQHAVNGDMIAIYDEGRYVPVQWTRDIPATLQGRAAFNVSNALAATAIAYKLNIPVPTIRHALSTFGSSYQQNPGRLNIYDELPFRVIVDYGHNPSAMKLMADLVRQIKNPDKKVIAVLGGTGDRRDKDIEELGAVAASMLDELIIKDVDARGRAPGETAAVLRRGAIQGGMREKSIILCLEEEAAVKLALQQASAGDLVLLFADDVNRTWLWVTSFKQQFHSSLTGNAN